MRVREILAAWRREEEVSWEDVYRVIEAYECLARKVKRTKEPRSLDGLEMAVVGKASKPLSKKALKELADLLGGDNEPEDLQNDIYQIAKKNDVQPKDFFKTLYQIILSTNRGPKIGPFIVDIGRKKIAKTLSSYT